MGPSAATYADICKAAVLRCNFALIRRLTDLGQISAFLERMRGNKAADETTGREMKASSCREEEEEFDCQEQRMRHLDRDWLEFNKSSFDVLDVSALFSARSSSHDMTSNPYRRRRCRRCTRALFCAWPQCTSSLPCARIAPPRNRNPGVLRPSMRCDRLNQR